jgi:hypothetical protein
VITVANATAADARRFDSSFGPCVDLFAPGDGILSAGADSDTGTATLSGTSMASPHVAGVAAQILERNPGLIPAQVAASIVQLHTTPDLISDPGPGTPNRMLFAGDDGFGSASGDFNGDGRDDIATFTRSAGSDVFVALSTGTSFGSKVKWHNTFAPNNTIPLVGDFNGDGKDDIVVFNRENVGDVFVALSNGSSFVGTGQRWHQDFAFIADVPMVGDFNGDGKDDIAAFTRGPQADVFVALSGGASFGFRTKWHDFFSLGAEVPVVGDFNGDGRDDIACFTKDPGNDVFVATSNGSSFVGQGQVWHSSFGFGTEVVGAGDFTGDGRDDIVAFARGSAADVFVGGSTGTSFTGRILWHDSFAANSEIPQPGSLW